MDESIPEIREACPGCEPGVDWDTIVVRWCAGHQPDFDGLEDSRSTAGYFTGSMDAGGESNQAVCDFLHRDARGR